MSGINAKAIARALGGRPAGPGKWMAHCPAHDDTVPSLSIAETPDGKVLFRCFAGCPQEAVIAALRERGLWPGGGGGALSPHVCMQTRKPANAQADPGLTLEQYAAAKRLPLDFLRGLGLDDVHVQGRPALRIPYTNECGEEIAVRFRMALEGPQRFRWRRGDKAALYGLWRLDEARRAGYVVIVEGESDSHTLWLHDIPALGLPGAGTWQETWAEYLADIPTIYVVVEPDGGGQAVMRWLATSAIRQRSQIVRLDAKDPSALYLADPEHFSERFQDTLARAVPFAALAAAGVERAQAAAWDACRDLAMSDDILAVFAQDLARCGVAGEERLAKLVFLAMISRLLDRPVSLAVKGPASAGKSFVVERVLQFFPSSAYYALSAMSERALAYSDEPLAHRVFVIYEAAGLRSEFAQYLLRSLLSEGRVRYETVEKTTDGLRPRLIEREGPTGLIVTTTAVELHAENETRLLSVTATDTPEQTKAVLRALAAEDAGGVDWTRWHALQEWLAAGECRVTVPFAQALADAVPPVATRLRRDFGAVLALIRAHALLHRATRERDREGRIVATLCDYDAIRDLVADIIAEGAGRTVAPVVRETVEAVHGLNKTDGATVAEVAGALGVDTSTAWRRVQVAINRGWLRNLEDRPRRPARLVLGDPLPTEAEVLPTFARLRVCMQTKGDNIPPSPPGENHRFDEEAVKWET
jgi:hypothetical protein